MTYGFHATKIEVAVDRKQDGEMKWTASAGAGVNLPLTGWSGGEWIRPLPSSGKKWLLR